MMHGHGMTRREQQVMDAHEEGASIAMIAEELELPQERVRRIVSTYRIGVADTWMSNARTGSAALAQAIRRHHPSIGGGRNG
jgi:hypothetical protein